MCVVLCVYGGVCVVCVWYVVWMHLGGGAKHVGVRAFVVVDGERQPGLHLRGVVWGGMVWCGVGWCGVGWGGVDGLDGMDGMGWWGGWRGVSVRVV